MLAKKLRFGLAALTAIAMLSVVSNAQAQDSALSDNPNSGISKKLESNWKDFTYYIRIGSADLVNSFGQKLLSDATPKQLYKLSVAYSARDTLIQGTKLKGASETCKKILKAVDDGFMAWRKDPEEIKRSIELLARHGRAQRVGEKRLKLSGEYALPLLISRLYDKNVTNVQRLAIKKVLGKLGRHAVRGLVMVLQASDPDMVIVAADALAEIQYPSALPRLREALDRDVVKGNKDCRAAITNALLKCAQGDVEILKAGTGKLFLELAQKYYRAAESLRHGPLSVTNPLAPDHRYKQAFVWTWVEGTGPSLHAVPKSIFCDIYAMRMARLALKHNPKLFEAIPLWLSAVTRRELDLKEGEKDPLWGENEPKADYYLLASSPKYLEMVLAKALKDSDVLLASRVINALQQNTGPRSLGSASLVAAMRYPDKALRYQAAIALMMSCPTNNFNGSDAVLSLINESLRQSGQRHAIIIANPKNLNKIKDAVRGAGFETVETADIKKLREIANKMRNLDTIVVGPLVDAKAVRRIIRTRSGHRFVPIITCNNAPSLREFIKLDGKMVQLPTAKIDDAAIEKAIAAADKLAAGRALSEEQAIKWAIQSAKAVAFAGQRGNTIYDLKLCIDSLIKASRSNLDPQLQIEASRALATINDTKAQQAIVTLALLPGADQEVRVAALNAASESVRRFGNYCTETQCKNVEKLVITKGALDLMNAAAKLLGTMNLPSQKGAGLIQSTKNLDSHPSAGVAPDEKPEPKVEEEGDDDGDDEADEDEDSDDDDEEADDDEDEDTDDEDDEDEDDDDEDEDEE